MRKYFQGKYIPCVWPWGVNFPSFSSLCFHMPCYGAWEDCHFWLHCIKIWTCFNFLIFNHDIYDVLFPYLVCWVFVKLKMRQTLIYFMLYLIFFSKWQIECRLKTNQWLLCLQATWEFIHQVMCFLRAVRTIFGNDFHRVYSITDELNNLITKQRGFSKCQLDSRTETSCLKEQGCCKIVCRLLIAQIVLIYSCSGWEMSEWHVI